MGKQSRLKALRKNISEKPVTTKQEQVPSGWPKIPKTKTPSSPSDTFFKWTVYALTFLSILYLGLAVFKPGMPSGHDIIAHTIRSKIFMESLHQGQFPVRWVDWITNNFSGPLFNFYQVGFYYLVALVNQSIPSLYESIKTIVLLSWWLGALFMFLYSKRFGNLAGCLAALIFAFTPYLIGDFFVRAAYPESLAIALSIGVLWSLDRILTQAKPIYGLPLSLCLAGILITHLPTVVIIFPIFIGYTSFLIFNKEVKFQGFFLAAVSSLVGIGLSAFYLFPSLLELNLVKSSLLTSAYYDFHPHFVYPEQLFSSFWGFGISQAGPKDGMSFQVGIIQWLIILTSLGVVIYQKVKRRGTLTAYLIFWLLAVLYSLFFVQEISVSFWENIKTIAFIQYPWRYLMIIALSTPILAALLAKSLSKHSQQAIMIFLSLALIIIFYRDYLHPATFLPDSYFKINTNEWQQSEGAKGAYLEEGYLPITAEQLPEGELKKWAIEKGQGKVEEKTILNHYKYFTTQSEAPIDFILTTHYFPGWKAYIDNIETKAETTPGYGFMKINIPAGLHKVEFKFTNTPIRSIANAVTLLSLLAITLWQLSTLKPIKKALKGLTASESL